MELLVRRLPLRCPPPPALPAPPRAWDPPGSESPPLLSLCCPPPPHLPLPKLGVLQAPNPTPIAPPAASTNSPAAPRGPRPLEPVVGPGKNVRLNLTRARGLAAGGAERGEAAATQALLLLPCLGSPLLLSGVGTP